MLFDALFLQTRESFALLSNFVTIWAKSCEVSATQLCEQIRQRYKDRYSKTFLGKDYTKQKKQISLGRTPTAVQTKQFLYYKKKIGGHSF